MKNYFARMFTASPKKIGRNDRCLCGSGKKYKHCCLNEVNQTEGAWRSTHLGLDRMGQELLRFTVKRGMDIEAAWEDYNLDFDGGPFDPRSPENAIFVNYFLYRWCPAEDKGGPLDRSDTIQAEFTRIMANLGQLEVRLFQECMTRPFTFYEVLATDPGHSMDLREIFTGEETRVLEHKGSLVLRRGDIVFAQAVSASGISVLTCNGPTVVPPSEKGPIIGLRLLMRDQLNKQILSQTDVALFEESIRALYLKNRDYMHAPPVPILRNTDGEDLAIHTMTFEVGSAQLAFDLLHTLAVGVSKEDLLERAEYDDQGNLRAIEFDWLKLGNQQMKSWENTIMGKIRIEDRSLTAEANSEKRATRLRNEIEKRLGLAVTHKNTVVEPYEKLLEKARNIDPATNARHKKEQAELMKDPGIRAQLKETIQKEVDLWINRKLPALGGVTPLQASKNPDGREFVESLVIHYERQVEEVFPKEVRPDLSYVRKRLKLDGKHPAAQ